MSFAETNNMEMLIAKNEVLVDEEDTTEIISPEDNKPLVKAENDQQFLTEKQLRFHINAVRETIKKEEKRIRTEYPWLQHQNEIGLAIFFGSLLLCFSIAALYLKGYLPVYLTIPLMAIPISFLHELEHDLIHNLYFKSRQWVQHVMFAVIWMSKMSINPWYRKVLHLRHHILSGQVEDLEERFIGLGMPLNWLRCLINVYPFSNTLLFSRLHKDNQKVFGYDMQALVVLINLPGVIVFTVLQHLFIGYMRVFFGLTFGVNDPVHYFPLALWPYVRDIVVILILPNFVRQICLNIVASYCHYYGDIPKHNVYYQNQVLNHWILYPLHLFSFNFGATHIIHHFVTNQPFYLRQWLAPKATEELIKHGIRNNDFGVVRRNNRYFDNEEEIKKGA